MPKIDDTFPTFLGVDCPDCRAEIGFPCRGNAIRALAGGPYYHDLRGVAAGVNRTCPVCGSLPGDVCLANAANNRSWMHEGRRPVAPD